MELGLNVFDIYLESIRQKNLKIRKKNKKKLKKKPREKERERERERQGYQCPKNCLWAYNYLLLHYLSPNSP